MRRPLFVFCVCLVVFTALRLETGWADRGEAGRAGVTWLCEAHVLSAAETLRITGQVYRKDEKSLYLKSVVLSLSNARGQSAGDLGQSIPCQDFFICETAEAMTVPLGSIVTLEGIFSPFSRAGNPGEFDSFLYYRTLGIGGKIRKGVILSQGGDNSQGRDISQVGGFWPLREGLFRLKCRLKERLFGIFPEKEAAVMSALLLGDKGDLDDELKDLYQRNGILHILSISSLHITIIGLSVYKLLRKAGLPVWLAAGAGCLLLLLYGCMTGFGVSVCRAIGMYLLKMLAEAAGRTYDMLTALGLVGAVMVVHHPYYLQSSGFLLSFASVLGIGVVYPALLPALPGESGGEASFGCQSALRRWIRKMGKMLCQSAFASLSVTLATLPVQLWFYYEVPVYAVLLNLFVIPFLKPMLITGLLTLAVPGLEMLGYVDFVILKGYEILCGGFDRLPFRTWNPGCPRLWQIAVYYLLLLGAAAIRRHRKKTSGKPPVFRGLPGGWAEGVCLCAVCFAVWLLGLRPSLENSVLFLDVGQGDCVLVRTSSDQTYLFDCGSSSRGNVGKYVLIPCLKYYGIHKIDAVFLSHPDTDHVNGALELFALREENGITLGELVLPAIEKGARREQFGDLLERAENSPGAPVPVGYLSAGESWSCGGAVFTCLHPEEGVDAGNANAYSQCIYAEFREKGDSGGKWFLLLTGDVEGEGEAALLEEILARNIHDVTVLKVAHHGSRNSTPAKLLAQIRPVLAVISCGRDNGYGHPHAQLLERLEESGAYIVQTARSGAVTVTFLGGAVQVSSYAAN